MDRPLLEQAKAIEYYFKHIKGECYIDYTSSVGHVLDKDKAKKSYYYYRYPDS